MRGLIWILELIISVIKKLRSPYIEETKVPDWLAIAKKEIGIKEIMNGDNPRIVEYHSATTLAAVEDSVYWCASFVCWCLESAGIQSTKSAWAKSYLSWGYPMDKPETGCIVIFTRGTGGHVGFYTGEDKEYIYVLGGNQGDQVNISPYSKANFLGYRWPYPLT